MTPDWLSVTRSFDGDAASSVRAFVELARYSQQRGLAEQYPTSEALAQAITAREAHYRACRQCYVSEPEHACLEGQRLEQIVEATS